MRELIDKLYQTRSLSGEEFCVLIRERDRDVEEYARRLACRVKEKIYGNLVYIRGLIEFTNYCRNDCYYCGIRRSNHKAERYRLTREEILACCSRGYELGFRTFVLQGGEDVFFTTEKMRDIIEAIKSRYPDCALTLSIGEKDEEVYRVFREAGADRYLLRHETADEEHYRKLHPEPLTLQHRKECLRTLKRLGYQTGAGFMVGSPGQTPETIAEDFLFMKDLQPEMVGIGPFIAHKDTPLGKQSNGTLEDTLFYLALIRLMMPRVLLPATTALGTIHPEGRELGILSGANVVMPNLSPSDVREKYMLYNGKLCTGDEAAEHMAQLEQRIRRIGCSIAVDRGDYKKQ